MSDFPTSSTSAPRVRAIVVNYNGGDMTLACVERLEHLDWPPDRLEIVVVDNASKDHVADALADRPRVRLIRSEQNLGFAGGVNLGLEDLGAVEYVALVNNDAIPDQAWLTPLVAALEVDSSIGAACPKILLQDRFVKVELRAPTFQPGSHDPRDLGVMVGGVRVDGREVHHHARFVRGFWGEEHDGEGPFQWTTAEAELWVPVEQDSREIEIVLRAPERREVKLSATGQDVVVIADAAAVTVKIPAVSPFDVINNVGCRLVAGGWAGDRGFLEVDHGQYEEPEEVFGWCGAAAVLRRGYLDDVGVFDGRLFLYYEDVDLSWRGRLRGWRYVYVPAATVRHVHSATSGEGSAVFTHFVDRNRLLVFARNAPVPVAADALARAVSETARIAWRDVVRPTIRSQPRQTLRTKQKVRSLGGVARAAIWMLKDRHAETGRLRVSRAEVAAWATPR